jgi:hypothetical protein
MGTAIMAMATRPESLARWWYAGDTLFEARAQDFKNVTSALRQLIEEAHAIVR